MSGVGVACGEYVEHTGWQGAPYCARCLRPPYEHPRGTCAVCNKPIHRALEGAWVHDQPHNAFCPPIHAPTPRNR